MPVAHGAAMLEMRPGAVREHREAPPEEMPCRHSCANPSLAADSSPRWPPRARQRAHSPYPSAGQLPPALPTVATGTLLGPAARSASEHALDATRAAYTSGESPNIDQMTSAQAQTSAIRPFVVDVPEEDISDLRRRLAATRWPSQETVADRTQGVQLAKLQALVQYWATDYDWRRVESRLNALPQFMTQIDGLDIHFIHVRSQEPNALPLIITHGWPGSVIEQLSVVDPLTRPTAYGGAAEDAFDLVIPSIPASASPANRRARAGTPTALPAPGRS